MRNFLSITAVLSVVVLATQVVAQASAPENSITKDLGEIEEPQLFFGGRRQGGPSRIQQYDEPFGIKKISYPRELRNHALVRFNARKHNDVQLPVPAGFSSSSFSLVEDPIQSILDNLDVWSRSSDDMVLAHFTDKQFELFEKAMLLKGVPEGENDWQVVERDLQQVADDDAEQIYLASVNQQLLSASGSPESEVLGTDKKKRVDLNTWFKNYHPHNKIKDFYLQLADDYPNLITFIPSIGKTVEERDIFAIKLTAKEEDGSIKEKPQIWWQGLQHAREWAGGSTVQYLTHHLTSNYGKNDIVTAILRDTEFVIVPVMNLDGYDYTWTNNRLWRKNRSKVGMGMYGVDLNRNWDDHFGEGGSSNLPWSETYRGPHAASEPEVKAMQDFFSEQKRIVGAIDFHCYSQLVLRPEGWTTAPSPHEKEHKFVGDKIVSLIQSVHGKKYISEPSVALYKTTGAGSDWFYGEKATKANNGQRVYSYTIELRPSENGGRNGFVLPPEEILPLGEEIAKAMEFFVDYVVKNPLK
ncbi:unnamed protein product [Mortierella alpina]